MTTRPRTDRSGQLRAAGYHRVSSEEQVEGYSLDAQGRATRLYCEAHGWALVGEHRDEGKSARTDDLAKRPDFARLLADAEAGRFDVVVVHKLDRFSRNLLVTLDTLQRLERRGGYDELVRYTRLDPALWSRVRLVPAMVPASPPGPGALSRAGGTAHARGGR